MATDGIAIVTGSLPASPTSAGRSRPRPQTQAARPAAVSKPAQPPAGDALPDVKAQLESLVKTLQDSQRNLSFSVDEGTGKTVVRVVRRSTGEVVRQIPSEEALAIAERLKFGEQLTSLGFERWS